MISKPFQIVLVLLLIVVGGAAVGVTHLDNVRLRKRVADVRRQGEQAAHLRDDNRRTRELLARAEVDEGDGVRAIHADLVRVRAAVTELEQGARKNYAELRAQEARDAHSLATNRNPETGMTRLENFQNVGQSTPAAAFQTFVWAAMKGEDEKLAGMIAFGGAAREKAEAVVAGPPEAARAKYPTPEKLAALFFAATFTALPSAEVLDVSVRDAQQATVSVRGLTEKTQKIPMQLGPQGWQIVIPPGMAEKLGGWALGSSSPAKK